MSRVVELASGRAGVQRWPVMLQRPEALGLAHWAAGGDAVSGPEGFGCAGRGRRLKAGLYRMRKSEIGGWLLCVPPGPCPPTGTLPMSRTRSHLPRRNRGVVLSQDPPASLMRCELREHPLSPGGSGNLRNMSHVLAPHLPGRALGLTLTLSSLEACFWAGTAQNGSWRLWGEKQLLPVSQVMEPDSPNG